MTELTLFDTLYGENLLYQTGIELRYNSASWKVPVLAATCQYNSSPSTQCNSGPVLNYG